MGLTSPSLRFFASLRFTTNDNMHKSHKYNLLHHGEFLRFAQDDNSNIFKRRRQGRLRRPCLLLRTKVRHPERSEGPLHQCLPTNVITTSYAAPPQRGNSERQAITMDKWRFGGVPPNLSPLEMLSLVA
jgi:hypothetical protein